MTQLEERAGEPADETSDPDRIVMSALRSHVPLSLIFDIARPDGPGSEEIAHTEGGDAGWLAGG